MNIEPNWFMYALRSRSAERRADVGEFQEPADTREFAMQVRTDLTRSSREAAIFDVEDPLGHDRHDDVVVTTTRRAISRVAYVAAETASRFEREAVGSDPVAWLFAPRRIFDGEAAIDACMRRDAFQRAILLHGLSLGLDANPEEIDRLLDDDEDCDDNDFLDPLWGFERPVDIAMDPCSGTTRLFSATINHHLAGRVRLGFHASMALSMGEFRARVASIFGSEALDHAVLCEGVNSSVRIVEGLVAPELMKSLVCTPVFPGRRMAVTVEHVVELDS